MFLILKAGGRGKGEWSFATGSDKEGMMRQRSFRVENRLIDKGKRAELILQHGWRRTDYWASVP